MLSSPKFWLLYLTLAIVGKEKPMLKGGLAELASFGVEDSYDNRIMLAEYLPEDTDK